MMDFKELLKNEYLILDGATGSHLQENGMKVGECPEQFAIENPEVIRSLQRDYIKAGSKVVYASTFGANRKKLAAFGLENDVYEMNKRLVEISKEAADGKALVGGDIGGTGAFIKPLGDLSFEDMVDIYKEQIRGFVDGGADLVVIETMIDLNEARAAVLAAKETCDLPVFVTMTFDESARTLTGTSPKAAAIALQAAGADAVGLNCSTGPFEMVQQVREMKSVLDVPLIVKPNAGIPVLKDGKTVFNLSADDFVSGMRALVDLGADIIGGCCGTTPEYIEKLTKAVSGRKPELISTKQASYLSSNFEEQEVPSHGKFFVIGERINPTGKKALKESFLNGDISLAVEYANTQRDAGADALDVNVGVPGIDEKSVMEPLVGELGARNRLPLVFDSSYPETIAHALRIYPGRALINSISAEKDKADVLLPLQKKYGAMAILLPIGEKGIPATAIERAAIIEELFSRAEKLGLKKHDFLVDGLAFAISSSLDAAEQTFKTLEWCKENGFKTVLGVSNASFGLPQRQWVNLAYLSAAMQHGLTAGIINPNEELLMNTALATGAVLGRDPDFGDYIDAVANVETKSIGGGAAPDSLFDAVVGGKDPLSLIKKEIEIRDVQAIIDEEIIRALNHVGDLFAAKKYFLPQLLASARTAKTVFDFIEPYLEAESGGAAQKTKVVMATVKGDIHDIGKNLVALMLKNHGFDVIDLGKDVPSEVIVRTAKETGAKLVGLSALMTTTAQEMAATVAVLGKETPDIKVMVGGAVVTPEFAEEIGAHGYSKDAAEAVKTAKKLTD
ncbi:MAG: homocysteine S-methyltransferase family protein [Eubacteriales bacterium]